MRNTKQNLEKNNANPTNTSFVYKMIKPNKNSDVRMYTQYSTVICLIRGNIWCFLIETCCCFCAVLKGQGIEEILPVLNYKNREENIKNTSK